MHTHMTVINMNLLKREIESRVETRLAYPDPEQSARATNRSVSNKKSKMGVGMGHRPVSSPNIIPVFSEEKNQDSEKLPQGHTA